MLNAEKYKDEILEVAETNCNIAFNIKEERATNCTYTPCRDCLFKKYNGQCNKARYEWLVSEYKEPILDEVERKYLSKLCEPFTVKKIEKLFDFANNFEWISVVVMRCDNDSLECINLPFFKENTMYKGLKRNKVYIPQQLGIRCKNNPMGEIKHE